MRQITSRVGKRGTIVMPVEVRERYGLDEGTMVIVEEQNGGILLRPAVAVPVEVYTPQRRAEFILNNAVDEEDCQQAVLAVREMGLDPTSIDHQTPFDRV